MKMQLRLFLASVLLVISTGARAQGLPAQQLAISVNISTAQQTFKSGTEVPVKVTLLNNSNRNMSLWWEAGEGIPYTVEVRSVQDHKLAPETRWGLIRNRHVDLSELSPGELSRALNHSGAAVTVKPGQSSSEEVNISKFYDLTAPGEYMIQLVAPKVPEIKGEFRSNIVTVTVVP